MTELTRTQRSASNVAAEPFAPLELALLVLAASACATPRELGIRQAAFDHRCPEDSIRVLRTSGDRQSLELDVCGATRRYQDLAGNGMKWVDVTGCAPAPSGK